MKVLLVEDDASLREGMGEIIAEQAEVQAVGTEHEALAALDSGRFDLVITDLRIGNHEHGGRTVLEAARRRQQAVAIVSAAAPDEVSRTLRPHVPDAVLVKPFQLDDILTLVDRFTTLRQDVERLGRPGSCPRRAPGRRCRPGCDGAVVGPDAGAGPAWV
ncbi:response regulator, partial [Pyxidicoccus sp. 3LFB2]